jgi:two-component system sensor histidine kinase RpfC
MESRNLTSDSNINPSDVGQSIVRVAIVVSLYIWALYNEGIPSYGEIGSYPVIYIGSGYVLYSFAFLLLSIWMDKWSSRSPVVLHSKRVVSLCVDLAVVALFLFLGGDYALVAYPIFVTVVVGYGLRFGLYYFLLAIVVAITTFAIASHYNPLFQEFESLTIGFYLGLILIPGYAAILLKKYQDLLRRLAETNAARARFIANMSHELRTPLHAIIGNAEVLSARLSEMEQRDPEFGQLATSAKMVTEASEHLRALVDGVLDIASNDAGTFVLGEARDVDLYRLIRSAVGIAAPGTRKPEVGIRWFVDPNVPQLVVTWEQHLRAVLINTIGNAVKYTDCGTISVVVDAPPRGDDAQSALVRILISDTGIGIPEAQLKTIFEPFVIGDDSRARRFEGTGLGLTITKQYIDEMRGQIGITSIEGTGTSVEIEIPMRIAAAFRTPLVRSARALLVAPFHSHAKLVSWLESGNLICTVVGWDGRRFVGEDDAGQPDIVFVTAPYLQDAEKITRHAGAIYRDALPAFIGPADTGAIRSHFATRIEEGNDEQLKNIFSLIDSGYAKDTSRHATRHKILVVDDNETNLQSADIALQSYGHDVHTVSDGNAALEILRHQNFDLVFMDMHMPGMSGLDVSSAYVRESKAPVPVVILTADATRTANTDADIPEVAGFLTKPIKPSELQHAVERYATKPGANRDGSEARGASVETSRESELFSRSNYMELLESGVDVAALESLIAKFRMDARAIIDEIRHASAAKDRASIRRLLHKLKGSAGAMHLDGVLAALQGFDNIADDDLCVISSAWCASLEASATSAASQVLDFIRTNADEPRARTVCS